MAGLARRTRRLAILVGATGLAAGLCLLLVRETYGWFFPVTSGSMAPTLMAGDVVFVRYDRGVPERDEIVVFAEADGGATTKRATALPGSKVRIDRTGDLRIDGELSRRAGRDWLVPLFDSRLQSIGEVWAHGFGDDPSIALDPWTRTTPAGPGEVWALDGRGVPRGSDIGLLRLRSRLDDGWLGPDGQREYGQNIAHDLRVDFDARIEDGGGLLRVQVTEQGDVFRAFVTVYAEAESSDVYLERRTLPSPFPVEHERLFGRGRVTVPLRRWIHVSFSNIDNRVRFELDGQVVEAEYERNTLHPQRPDDRPYSAGERVALGASNLRMEVKNVVVSRDLQYVPAGAFGVDRTLLLGPEEIFLLGDASAASRDSRERGPLPVQSLVGRVEAIVWPLARARRL